MRLRFIDRITALKPRSSIVVEKCVSFEEANLDRPSAAEGVPPLLMLEWLGQAAGVLVAESTNYKFLPLVGSIEKSSFGAPLFPGDIATIKIDVSSWHEGEARANCEIQGPEGRGLTRLTGVNAAFVPLEQLWDPEQYRLNVFLARREINFTPNEVVTE